ncbi:hypothetical protein RJ639_031837 [Escallonia herrerae]|uniref:Nucleic acid binding protein n=1 Tax=Escallonia herrerae TaxID=1293975 RepID=A0AA88X1N3_9ASTE|nr:hypothetical protein RJ639_031837 [Escallonia herrerae]
MAKGRTQSDEEEAVNGAPKREHRSKRKSESEQPDAESEFDSGSEDGRKRSSRSTKKSSSSRSSRKRSRRKYSDDDSYSEDDGTSDSGSDSGSSSEFSSEEERRQKRRRRERKRREEREREKEKRKKRSDKEKKKRKKGNEKKKKKKDKGMQGAVTNLWGKYGIIKETDMWNKRPEFTAWLLEVKQVRLYKNEEDIQGNTTILMDSPLRRNKCRKQMKGDVEFSSEFEQYYNLDAYYGRKMEKEMKKGFKKVAHTERIVFNDEEQRRLELQREREKQKEEEVQALKRSMQSGMAQAMKEQAQLREQMAYEYKIGNFEAAAAIQRRLDPDIPM